MPTKRLWGGASRHFLRPHSLTARCLSPSLPAQIIANKARLVLKTKSL
jgi:hypothetical protein